MQTNRQTTASMLRGAYSPLGAADYLSISRTQVYRYVASGDLRGFKLGRLLRFTRAELDTFIAHQSGEGADGGGGHEAA